MKQVSAFLIWLFISFPLLVGQNSFFLPLGQSQQAGLDSLSQLGVSLDGLQVVPQEITYSHHGATFLYQYASDQTLQAVCMNRRFEKWSNAQEAMNNCLRYFRSLRMEEIVQRDQGQSHHYVWLAPNRHQRFEMKVLPLGKRQFLIQLSRRISSDHHLAKH